MLFESMINFHICIALNTFKNSLGFKLLLTMIQLQGFSSFIVLLTHKYSQNRHKFKHFVTSYNMET